MSLFKVGTTNESNRVNWIEKTLLKIPQNCSILDAGAGESQFKKFCSHLKYISQDFAQYDGTGEVGRIKRVASEFSNTKVNIIDKIFIHGLLATLQKLSKKNKNSEDLLAYGVHVFAQKKF